MNTALAERYRLAELFDAIDRKDTGAFLEFLADNASFRFGSAPLVHGREAIGAGVSSFFDSIGGSRHELSNVISDADTVVCEGTVSYKRLDGKELSVPFVDVFEYAGERISAYKIYIDIGPLFAD